MISTLICFILLITSDIYDPTTLVFPPFGHSGGYHKITPYSIRSLLRERISFNDPQGIAAVKLEETDDPSTVNDDDELTFFAVNAGSGQIIYNIGFSDIGTYGSSGAGENQLWEPQGIAVTTSGDIYVADKNNHRIVHLKYSGGKIEKVRTIGSGPSSSPGELSYPQDVAVDSRGNIYVTDTGNSRITVFDRNGNFKKVIGVGYLNKPFGIAITDRTDRWAYYRDRDYIAVTDAGNTRLTTYDFAGNRLKSLDGLDINIDDVYFGYLAIDYYGMIYATDRRNSKIHVFTRDMKYITSYGREGSGDKEFHSPRGIAIWKRYGQIMILEQQAAQYYWLGIDGFIKGAFPATFTHDKPGTTISIYITQPADITLIVYDERGNLVRNLLPQFRETPGFTQILWDGRDNKGELVQFGQYRIELVLEPTYSSKGYFKKELLTDIVCQEFLENIEEEEISPDSL